MRAPTISPAIRCPAMAPPNACCGETWRRRWPKCRPISPATILGLKVYDCYRPTRAVAAFARWAQQKDDGTTKRFYPALDKRALFAGGYIAAHSAHSTGNAVDLTLVPRPAPLAPPFDPHASYGACTAPAEQTRARQCARHGHRLRLPRSQELRLGQHHHVRAKPPARHSARGHAQARLP